jgi:serine/threonine-protein kinase
VKISFASSPLGAKVVRKDTGEELGTTPFDRVLPFDKEPVAFVFKKDGFLDQEMGLAPTSDSQLQATLPPARVAAPPEATPPKAGRAGRGGRKPPATASAPAKAPGKKPGGKTPVDEDGVLEPTFK